MRYLYYILAILLFSVIAITISGFLSPRSPHQETALVVNNRVITTGEIEEGLRHHPTSHSDSINEYIDNLIRRELMIQEAQEQEIDQQENFRRAIQHFYEQSLVKALLEKKTEQMQTTANPETVARYLQLQDTLYQLKIITAGATIQTNYTTGLLLDLPIAVRQHLVQLHEGETTAPFKLNEEIIRIHLIKKEKVDLQEADKLTKKAVEKIVQREQLQTAMDSWIEDLKEKAYIRIVNIPDVEGELK